jgi:hypothetical protein
MRELYKSLNSLLCEGIRLESVEWETRIAWQLLE